MAEELSEMPKVEAVPEDISMEHEHPNHSQPQYHSHSMEEAHASFFQEDPGLDAEEQPEPPTPPQRARPDVAAEDLQLSSHGDDQIQQLQLAAQMSQALQGVVGSTAAAEDHSFESQQDGDLEDLQQLQDEEESSGMHSREHSLPEAPGLPDVSADNIPSSVHQDLERTLQQVIQHPEPEQDAQPQHNPRPALSPHTQYLGPLQQTTLAPAIPVGGTQSQYALGDMTPPRKRSKVSRACDECRRKKVKCDSATENSSEACSNCRRSNVRCMFSRVPQKRGPSKGYIKELADRINSIEGKLGGQSVAEALAGELASRGNLGESYALSAQGEDIRKRPFSQISSGTFSTPVPNRQPALPLDPRPLIPHQPSYSANGLALKPILPRESIILPQGRAPDTDVVNYNRQVPQSAAVVAGIDDNVYHAYLNTVHNVLPFLASTREVMTTQLAQCSSTLQNAFIEALNSTMRSFGAAQHVQGRLAVANRLLTDFDAEVGKYGQATDLVYLQCLILMIINVDNFGTVSLTREHEGPAKVSLLGRAAGLAYAMAIPHEAMDSDVVTDVESDQCIRIRAWWTLVVLDRWNAISTATPLVISGDAVILPSNLKPIFGEAGYRFTLLAYIMGHWSPASVTAPMNSTPGAGARASATFHLNMEMWRAHFPGDILPNVEPVLHLAYWHCRLLAFLFMPSALVTDVTWAVRESVRLLTSHPQMVSPLNHHFTSLTTLCLIEMAKGEKSHEEATQLLSNLLDASIAPSAWDESIRAKIRDALRPSTSSAAEATASQSLQHLADLATAVEFPAADKVDDEPKFRTSDNYDDLGFDPRPVLRAGYLNAIAQLSP